MHFPRAPGPPRAFSAAPPCPASPAPLVPLPPDPGGNCRWSPPPSGPPTPNPAHAETVPVDYRPGRAILTQRPKEIMGNYQISLPSPVGPVTAPTVDPGVLCHPRPHRVQLDVAVARPQIGVVLQDAGTKTPLPQGATIGDRPGSNTARSAVPPPSSHPHTLLKQQR